MSKALQFELSIPFAATMASIPELHTYAQDVFDQLPMEFASEACSHVQTVFRTRHFSLFQQHLASGPEAAIPEA